MIIGELVVGGYHVRRHALRLVESTKRRRPTLAVLPAFLTALNPVHLTIVTIHESRPVGRPHLKADPVDDAALGAHHCAKLFLYQLYPSHVPFLVAFRQVKRAQKGLHHRPALGGEPQAAPFLECIISKYHFDFTNL